MELYQILQSRKKHLPRIFKFIAIDLPGLRTPEWPKHKTSDIIAYEDVYHDD
jgi:hypothetical protein